MSSEPREPDPRHPTGGDVVPLRDATRAWFAISLQTFGGLRTLGLCALLGLGGHAVGSLG